MGLLEAIILAVLAASTPLLLAAAGELVVERAGVLNLGVEGMMIMGAACGFVGAYLTGSTLIGALCGIVAGAALSAVFALLTLGLAVNQVATGLALTILGVGLSGLIGAGFVGERIAGAPHLYLPVLTDLPFVGRILFGQDAFVYVSLLLVVASGGSCTTRGPGWCCARSATTTPRRMRWAIRCCGSACLAVLFGGALRRAWRAPTCRSPIRRF